MTTLQYENRISTEYTFRADYNWNLRCDLTNGKSNEKTAFFDQSLKYEP